MAQRPTFFKIQSLTDSGFKAVNLKHDYPQSIQYQFDQSSLKVIIQGRPNFEDELTEEWTLHHADY
jgi:hypothetical protein